MCNLEQKIHAYSILSIVDIYDRPGTIKYWLLHRQNKTLTSGDPQSKTSMRKWIYTCLRAYINDIKVYIYINYI